MAGDNGGINPHSFKRRLVRAAVQDNLNMIEGHWPRLRLPFFSPRSAWFSAVVMAAVTSALSPLLYVAATTSKASQEMLPAPAATRFVTAAVLQRDAVLMTAESASAALVAPFSLQPSTEVRSERSEAESSSDEVVRNRDEPANSERLVPEPRSVDLKTFALVVKKIIIDPGHGGEDPGAVVAHGLSEKAITLDIGLRLRALLTQSSYEVLMTRETDETRSLAKRSAFANAEGGDLFVSIHVNWLAPRRARVVETYYLGATEDAAALQLAGSENRQSGYSLADFRRLLEGVYADVKRGESRKLAETIQGELVHTLQNTNPTLPFHAVKTAPFAVLVGAQMPAILTEVACLSNKEDAQLLATPEYRQQIAQALFTGIRSYTNALEQAYATRKESPS